jgi:DNA-binding NarL/FixJ family response regulator
LPVGRMHLDPSSSDPFNVVVVDDHELVRESLMTMIAGLEMVDGVSGARCAGELLSMPADDYRGAVVDLVLPDIPGTTLLSRLAQDRPDLILIAITGHADTRAIRRAREAGAVTCLSKSSSLSELRLCMEAAFGGAVVLDSTTAYTLAHNPRNTQSAPLTRREREVLELIVAGLTARRIGENLIISEATVRAHRHRIYQKLGVGSRREAAELFHRDGDVRTAEGV